MENENEIKNPTWVSQLEKLNKLREKNFLGQFEVVSEILNENTLIVSLKGSSYKYVIHEKSKRWVLSPYNECELIDTSDDIVKEFINTQALKLILEHIKNIESIPNNDVKNIKKVIDMSMLVAADIIDLHKKYPKLTFAQCYYTSQQDRMYNLSHEEYLFSDWSELEEYTKNSLINFGYIVIDNHLKKL